MLNNKKEYNSYPLVSVVLGVKSGERTIEKFCQSVIKQTYPNIELIIVDNSSKDRTQEIARKYTGKVFTKGPERSAQRNFGIQQSEGEYILVLDADMYLSPTVVEEAVNIFRNNPDIKFLFIPEETIAEGFWGKCKVFERDFYLTGDITTEAARFFRRKELLEIGCFDENQTGSEDWDLSDKFLARYKYGRTSSALTHDEGKIELSDLLKKKNYYTKNGITNYLKTGPKHRKTPFPLRPSVIKQWHRFLMHPVLGTATILMKFLEGLMVFKK
jgi:glycosyltransferase involved in cell wall biosynthesis